MPMIDGVHEKEAMPAVLAELLTELKAEHREGAVVLALAGDLGAGKTTSVQMLGTLLGVQEPITSPTFTIMKQYETTDPVFETMIHMDAYRIEDVAELAPLRFMELLQQPQTLICIEWAERIREALPPAVLTLTLGVAGETARTVQVTRS